VIVPVVLVLVATRGGSDHDAPAAADADCPSRAPTVPAPRRAVIRTGDRAPRIVLTRLDCKGTIDTATYAGKPYIVTFWASWCGPCKKEMPLLQQAYTTHDGALPVVGVAYQDPESDSRKFAADHGITFPIARDDGVRYAEAFGVTNVPMTFFVDAQGVVHDRIGGIEKQSELDDPLGRLLATGTGTG
jgi:thiol-disulfide isomerase/thioredoxin